MSFLRKYANANAAARQRNARLERQRLAKVTETCGSHPEGGTHECLPAEMRCAYCGVRLAPYPCNGCGKFMTASEMHHNGEGDGVWRCGECT